MPNLKQIKGKIKSVQNLWKITKALEIVATVKLQKMKHSTEIYKSFMEDFLRILNAVKSQINIFENDQNIINKDWKRLLIVMTSDKWLCGPINSKLLKHIYGKYNSIKQNVDVFCIWKKWLDYFSRLNFNIVWSIQLKDNFEKNDLQVVNKYIEESIQLKKYAKMKVYFNYFKNTISQIPIRFKIFPLDQESFDAFVKDIWLKLDDITLEEHKEMMIEPNKEEYKKELIKQMVANIIYWAALQNKTGEFASKMIAMKSAKDNSIQVNDSLTIQYNKTRQWIITQEISEIVSAKVAIWD